MFGNIFIVKRQKYKAKRKQTKNRKDVHLRSKTPGKTLRKIENQEPKRKRSQISLILYYVQRHFAINGSNQASTLQYFDMVKDSNMRILLILLCLLARTHQANWQGVGNMSSSNLTAIWNFINKSDLMILDDFHTSILDYLNQQWHPAWNMFTIIDYQADRDTVIYGYAFRNHWIWYNGYPASATTDFTYSFVIWKDYNCDTYSFQFFAKGLGASASPTYSQAEKTELKDAVSAAASAGSVDDIWLVAKAIVDNAQAKSLFAGDHAFTVVLSQSSKNYYYAKACFLDGKFYSSNLYGNLYNNGSSDAAGTFFLMQMR